MILAIDTSDRSVSVALAREGEVVAAMDEGSGSTTENLLPLVDKILKQENAAFADLSKIVVARGPGSFTGIRAAIATGSGFQAGLNVPVVGVSIFEPRIFALVPSGESKIVACLVANKNDYFIAKVHVQKETDRAGQLRVLDEFSVVDDKGIEVLQSEGFQRLDIDALSQGAASCLLEYVIGRENGSIVAGSDSLQASSKLEEVIKPIYIKPVNAKTLVERGLA